MADDWRCRFGDNVLGPYSSEQMRVMAKDGRLAPDTLVRKGTSGAWRRAEQLQGLTFASKGTDKSAKVSLAPTWTPPPLPPVGPTKTPPSTDQARRVAVPVPSTSEHAPVVFAEPDKPDEASPVAPNRKRAGIKKHRGQLLLWIGVASCLCSILLLFLGCCGAPFAAISPLVWITGSRDLKMMRTGIMDPKGIGATRVAVANGIVGTIAFAIWLIATVLFVVASVAG